MIRQQQYRKDNEILLRRRHNPHKGAELPVAEQNIRKPSISKMIHIVVLRRHGRMNSITNKITLTSESMFACKYFPGTAPEIICVM